MQQSPVVWRENGKVEYIAAFLFLFYFFAKIIMGLAPKSGTASPLDELEA